VLLTNAAGGIHPSFLPGDLMLITDHLNLMGDNPLRGPNFADGPRFPDLSHAYDPALQGFARQAALSSGVTLHEGVYAAMLGPSYETPAEIRMLRALGADAVGMSTVPEVIALRQRGVSVGAMSCITNRAAFTESFHGRAHALGDLGWGGSLSELAPELKQLVAAARSVRDHAYAPYSAFKVGAALSTSLGEEFTGCNVENASYGATICAERSAVLAMVANAQRPVATAVNWRPCISALAVFTDAPTLALPCGLCRQVLAEFVGSALVVVANPREHRVLSFAELFPEPFVLHFEDAGR
jgi:homotetrameric cytidine deaminase